MSAEERQKGQEEEQQQQQTRLERLEERRKRLDAQIAKIKAHEAAAERKLDTRRKILVGAVVMELVEHGEWPKDRLLAMLEKKLTRPADRVLFGLSVPEVETASPAAEGEAGA